MVDTRPNSNKSSPVKNPHPLRMISAAEIYSLSRIIKERHPVPLYMIYTMDLQDPDKSALWEWESKGEKLTTCENKNFTNEGSQKNESFDSCNCSDSQKKKKTNVIVQEITQNCNTVHKDTDAPESALKRRIKVMFMDSKWQVWEYSIHVSNYHDGKILSILSTTKIDNVQPLIREEEFVIAEKVVKEDPDVLKFLLDNYNIKREDLHLLCVDPWSAGYYGNSYEKENRVVRCLMWHRIQDPEDNRFAHPLTGISIVVDILNKKVLKICDSLKDKLPVPQKRNNFNPKMRSKDLDSFTTRTDIKPLEIIQRNGPSFKVDDNHVSWQGWSFRVGYFPREGLVLYNLKFQDRPVCYKISTPEMSVPYGEPTTRSMGGAKNALDAAEYGLGYCGNSLSLGCDCLGEIYYFDAFLHTYDGTPYKIKNAICMHEEDAGILWKHWDWRTNESVTVRGRKLIVSFISTIGNYLYGFYYVLTQEGQIYLDVHLNGILNTFSVWPGDKNHTHGTEVSKGVLAGGHQHFFVARIDMCVDGLKNCISECNVVLEEDESKNAFGNAFRAEFTRLDSHKDAQRDNSTATSRFWKIYNPYCNNSMGTPTSYEFFSGNNVQVHSKKNSYMMKRCPWLEHNLFATQYNEDQQFPSGDYGNQSTGDNQPTLKHWTSENKSLIDQNIVLWHSFGVTHIPRLEEFPIMNVHHIRGFKLQPSGFLDENPCLDIPTRESSCRSKV